MLARTDIQSLEDLRGKKVNFGPGRQRIEPHRHDHLPAPRHQGRAGNVDQQSALQKLRSGEVDALVRVIGKPVGFFANIPANAGLHLLPIPFTKQFADYYTLGELTSKDYPNLIPDGQRVDTLAVPTVLAVFNWPKGSDRYRRVERFTEQLFAKFEQAAAAAAPSQVADVNLAATVPGLDPVQRGRRDVAEVPGARSRRAPSSIATSRPSSTGRAARATPANQTDRDALFRDFMQWRDQQRSPR